MAYEEIKSSGITADTPKNILFGAGTIHKGFKYTSNAWNFAESLIGATQGGSKFSIVPEISDIEVDGALVKVKGLAVKTGETATLEVNFVELTPEILAMATRVLSLTKRRIVFVCRLRTLREQMPATVEYSKGN